MTSGHQMSSDQISRIKFTKFDFAPDPAVGTYSAPHATYSWILVGLLLRGEREEGRGWEKGKKGEEGRGQFAIVCPLFNVDRDRRLWSSMTSQSARLVCK